MTATKICAGRVLPVSRSTIIAGHTGGIQPKHIAHLAHRDPLCWHRPLPRQKPKEGTLSGSAETPFNRATSSRNAERNHLGRASDIKSERRARSSRNAGRLPSESALGHRGSLSPFISVCPYRRPNQLQPSTRARARQKEIAAFRSMVDVEAVQSVPCDAALIMQPNSASERRP